MAAPSEQCESDSESVSFTLGYNWQEAGRGYHLSCHWAIVMGNGSSVCVCACVCVRTHLCEQEYSCFCADVGVCARVFVCHSRQQMEPDANWVEISGGVWSRLTRGWAAAPGLGSLPPLAPRLVLSAGSRLLSITSSAHPSADNPLWPITQTTSLFVRSYFSVLPLFTPLSLPSYFCFTLPLISNNNPPFSFFFFFFLWSSNTNIQSLLWFLFSCYIPECNKSLHINTMCFCFSKRVSQSIYNDTTVI